MIQVLHVCGDISRPQRVSLHYPAASLVLSWALSRCSQAYDLWWIPLPTEYDLSNPQDRELETRKLLILRNPSEKNQGVSHQEIVGAMRLVLHGWSNDWENPHPMMPWHEAASEAVHHQAGKQHQAANLLVMGRLYPVKHFKKKKELSALLTSFEPGN